MKNAFTACHSKDKTMGSLRVGFANLLWFCYSAYMARRWKRAARDVAGTQQSVLRRIIFGNRNCEFGREHSFSEIASIETYSQRVPVRAYEDFEPYIERIADGSPGVLTEQPVQQFGLTSGSTRASKLVPYTKSLVNEFQEGIDPWVYYLFRAFPRIFPGKTYWSVTPVGERKSHTSGGIAIGFDDEKQYFSPLTRWVLGSIMAVPSSLAQVKDIDTFRYVTLRLLLQEKSLSWVSVWNSSFLTLLLEPLAANFSRLIEDMRLGTLSVASEIEPPLRNAILPLCKASPARATELASLYAAWRGKPFTEPQLFGRTLYEAIWPRMRVISCWAHGNAVLHQNLHFSIPDRLPCGFASESLRAGWALRPADATFPRESAPSCGRHSPQHSNGAADRPFPGRSVRHSVFGNAIHKNAAAFRLHSTSRIPATRRAVVSPEM